MEKAARLTQRDSKSDPHILIANARRWFYSYKILNLFWFEGRLPHSFQTTFPCLMNTDWPENPPLPESIREIIDMTEAELEFICDRMLAPEWTRSQDVIRKERSLRHSSKI
jgi:hypothetical protein